MGKKLYILMIVAIVTLLVASPVIAGMSGNGASGVQIQNLSTSSDVNVTVELWKQDGSAALPISAPGGDTILKNTSKTYYLPTLAGVTDGAYAMAVSAGGPVAGIARTEWSSVGGAATYNSSAPGTDILIPLAVKGFAGQTSVFSIQNTNTAAGISDVEIIVYGRGIIAPVKDVTSQTILAGTSKTYSLDDALFNTPPLPDTGLDLGAPGFVGTIRIKSATPLAVQSYIDIPGTRAVGSFAGIATSSTDTTLYCPLVRANYYGDTGINIVNPNSSPVSVEITFRGDALSPHTGTFIQNISVPANSMSIAFQGPTGNSRSAPTNLPSGTQGTANPTLTNDGFFGVAELVATGGPISAVVNDTVFGAGWATLKQSSYNCSTPADASNSFALPLVRRYHLSSTKLTTGISIQNTGGSPITVSMDLYNWDGTRQAASDPADIVVPPYGSGNFWSGLWTSLPTVPPSLGGSGWFGSAVVTITGGTGVVLVDDQGYGSTAIDSANYNGFPTQ